MGRIMADRLIFLQPSERMRPEEAARLAEQLRGFAEGWKVVVIPSDVELLSPEGQAYSFTEKIDAYQYTLTFKTLAELKAHMATRGLATEPQPTERRGREFL